MYLVKFVTEETENTFGLFKSENAAESFVEKIENIKIEEMDGFKTYTILESEFPCLQEIIFDDNKIVLTKYSFPKDSEIEVVITFVPEISKGQWDEDSTIVDAYMISNENLKDYIEAREKNFETVKEALEKKGFEVTREMRNSIDGEAIMAYKDENAHFIAHLDPFFVESVDDILQEIEKM